MAAVAAGRGGEPPLSQRPDVLYAYAASIDRMNNRVLGYIISTDFDGRDHAERQKLLCEVIERELSREARRLVGPIVTMIPAEVSVKTFDE